MNLGLPSGTLWLDRLVGAVSLEATGLFYQWGDVVGHSIEESYDFSIQKYEEKGLNLITTDLDDAHDAARAYYGPVAKMPSVDHFNELRANCDITFQDDGLLIFTSRINGARIRIRPHGYFLGHENRDVNQLRAWSINHDDNGYAQYIRIDSSESVIYYASRYYGFNIMAIHS